MAGITGKSATGPIEAARHGTWLARWRPVSRPRLRLFCVPHAGGGAAAYRSWAHSADHRIEVIAIRLPGRETRFREAPVTRMGEVLPGLLPALAPWLDLPHAWFGHSLGALIAFEACHEIRRLGLAEPARLLVSGRAAPHLPPRGRPMHNLPTPEFVAQLRDMNGTPEEVLDDTAALSSLLPVLRADLTMVETYRCKPGPRLNYPISVFGGADDHLATAGDLHAWREHTAAECTVRIFNGGHFFLHESSEQVLSAICADLLSQDDPGGDVHPSSISTKSAKSIRSVR